MKNLLCFSHLNWEFVYQRPQHLLSRFAKIYKLYYFEEPRPHHCDDIHKEIKINFPDGELDKFIYYFQRHIELDGDEHGPLALKMIEELAQGDDQRWLDMQSVSKLALQKRIDLWDAIYDSIS